MTTRKKIALITAMMMLASIGALTWVSTRVYLAGDLGPAPTITFRH